MAVIVVVLAAPATTAVASPPAVDQYTTHLPGAGGNSGLASSSAPVAAPGQLPANVRAALTGADGQLLTLIATAPALGAPAVSAGSKAADVTAGTATGVGGASTSSSPQLTTAVADAAGSGPGLALLGVLAAIGIVAAGGRLVRRRRSSL
ncbi:MAG: hypothetical protein ACRDMH_09175 [Solirubrobacterales bacterium]